VLYLVGQMPDELAWALEYGQVSKLSEMIGFA